MRLKHLTLMNFRNYSRLQLAFPKPLTLLQGENAQGKSNLLEAIYMLATSRSPRAGSDRELINWLAEEDVQPYARIDAEVERADRTERIEITILRNNQGANGPAIRKQIRINGVNRRAMDLLGHLNVVLFVPQDVDLVAGSPSVRRRYLDITLCQINRKYCRALSQYNRVVVQRSHLLRQIRERGGSPEQLGYWNDALTEHGAEIIAWRRTSLSLLDQLARAVHHDLTGGGERLQLRYTPSLTIPDAQPGSPDAPPEPDSADVQAILDIFQARLSEIRQQEILQGVCLVGPHRDDLRFFVNDRDLNTYGSRGQQRTAALSLKMAEMRLMRLATGEHPVLLLDDVMSELDIPRRRYLLQTVDSAQQAILTTTDFRLFPQSFLSAIERLQVVEGRIQHLPQNSTEGETHDHASEKN